MVDFGVVKERKKKQGKKKFKFERAFSNSLFIMQSAGIQYFMLKLYHNSLLFFVYGFNQFVIIFVTLTPIANMFRFFIVASIFFSGFKLNAQFQKPPAIGKVFGKVQEESTKKPVEFATISVFNMRDSLIGGALTRANGDFTIEKLPLGPAKIKVYFIGYEVIFKTVKLMPPSLEQDLGNIRLKPSIQSLKQVDIVEEAATVTLSIDKRSYNPEKDLGARGGMAIDAMKSIPGITVNSDGSVQLRNAAPIIFVDGRPTALSLDQIPADQIERIEVITNPSAKYVADATAGILNIIMKKNLKPGYFGAINSGIGSNDRYSINGNLSVREGKWSFNTSYGFNTATNDNEGFTNRQNYINGSLTSANNLNTLSINTRSGHNARMAVDYRLTNRSTIFSSYNYNRNGFNVNENQNFAFLGAVGDTSLYGNRINIQTNSWITNTAQLGFKHNFPKQGKELTADLNYISSRNQNNSDFDTKNYFPSGELMPKNPELQQNRGARKADFITWQLDFINPINDTVKWEFGARAAYKYTEADFRADFYNYEFNRYLRDTLLSNLFNIDDFVGAAYATYTNMIKKKIGVQAGLRFEQTYFIGRLPEKNQSFEYIYPRGLENLGRALFPSLYFSRKLSSKNEVQLNFSRKIRRPDFMQVIPFIMFADRQSYQIGNPVLAPEFINLAEANLSRIYSKGSLLTSFYLRHITNSITNFFYPSPTEADVLVGTFINGKTATNFGCENTVKYSPSRMIDLNLNAHVFYTEISASQNNQDFSNSGFSWNTRLITNVRLPKKWGFQVNASYEAPRIIPQGRTREIYFVDLSASKEINKSWTASLTLSDMFNTKRFGSYFESVVFRQDLSRRWETRYVRLNITYKFGEPDISIFKKRTSQRRDPGSGGTEMPEM